MPKRLPFVIIPAAVQISLELFVIVVFHQSLMLHWCQQQ
jgi:hypothetical protein